MKQKYKVTLYTYIVAANVSEVKERINKKFKGRMRLAFKIGDKICKKKRK